MLAPATLAALPSTRAIPDRAVFYVADPIQLHSDFVWDTACGWVLIRMKHFNVFAEWGDWQHLSVPSWRNFSVLDGSCRDAV